MVGIVLERGVAGGVEINAVVERAAVPLAATGVATLSKTGQPLNIPPGYDFPAEKAQLERLRDTTDIVGMRRHAWMVFAGMTASAAAEGAGALPVWMTWYPGQQTFSEHGDKLESVMASLGRPKQFDPPPDPEKPGAIKIDDTIDALLSLTLFNAAAHQFIRERKYYNIATLNALSPNAPNTRRIEPFPRDAIVVKAVWWPLRRDGVSPLPVWDGNPVAAARHGYSTWQRVVAVSPADEGGLADELPVRFSTFNPDDGSRTSDERMAKVVPLSRLYTYTLTEHDLKLDQVARQVNSFFEWVYEDRTAQPGDRLALVGLHFMTKELDDWVWATLWWHDQPDTGEFAADRVPAVTGVWRNYLMDVAYTTGKPVFNPWLEGPLQNGVNLNCIACHQQAGLGGRRRHDILKKLDPSDPIFQGTLQTDYLWSIPTRAGSAP